ncbi:MAG: GNAT family N-acetyltransferase [Lachnospiraceae bacterium]|nr:GNAT family N-acetyltransferase [Lachnospiraceae bacterium]
MKLAIIQNQWTPVQQKYIQTTLKEVELILPEAINDCLFIKEPFILFSSSTEDYHFSKKHHFPFLGFGLSMPCPYLVENIGGLSDSYLHLTYARFYHLPFVLYSSQDFTLREYRSLEFDKVMSFYKLFQDNNSVEPLATDDSIALEQFSSRITEYGYKNHGLWGMFNAKEDLIGQIGITSYENGLELSYILHPDYQRKGIAFSFCEKVLTYAKEELGVDSLDIRIHPDNLPSRKLAEKLQNTEIINLQIITLE